MNNLKLRKCAYIFDWSNATYFCGNKERLERKHKVNKWLKEFYENESRRNEFIEYGKNENDNIYIVIDNEKHFLNDLQIAEIPGDSKNIVNHRRNILIDDIIENLPHFHKFTHDSIYSNKLRSLHFEFFTGSDDLGYIRVHFKNNCVRFIIDDRTGDIYTSGENGRHELTSVKELLDSLDISSEKAKNEFMEVINEITKKGAKNEKCR